MNYLYNGVELPDINEVWTDELKTQLAYARITPSKYANGGYFLTLQNNPARVNTATDQVWFGTGEIRKYDVVNGCWDYFEVLSGSIDYDNEYVLSKNPITWTSYDVMDADGSVYLSASDPIPVSSFVPDPTSMTLGWLVGRRIAGQRGEKIPDSTVATLTDGVLYIQNASAVLNSGVLEVT